MNYEVIKQAIRSDSYISYLRRLESDKEDGKLKNYWFANQTELVFIDLWNKCQFMGLCIDGDTVTITARGGVPMLSFDYHAYRNVVLLKYPETLFDQQLVYNGDDFSFRKESGKVIYSHTIANPFDTNKKIIGAYAVVKNSTGEFIDFVDMNDIEKMRKTSKMSNIWNAWLDRMVLKSVIKRICNVNFKDVVKEIDSIDNESYDLEKFNQTDYDSLVFKQIDSAKTYAELCGIYQREQGLVKDQKALIKKIQEVRTSDYEVTADGELYSKALCMLQSGKTIPEVKKYYYLTGEIEQKLIEDAANNL